MCASRARQTPLPPQPDKEGSNGSQPGDFSPRTPWAASVTDPPDTFAQKGRSKGGIFSIASGPTPDEIPGFPVPVGDGHERSGTTAGQVLQAGATAQAGQSAIQPLSNVARSTPAPPQATKAAQTPLPLPAIPKGSGTGVLDSTRTGTPQGGGNARVTTDQLATGYLDPFEAWFPEPRTIRESGIGQGLIADLVLKTMYYTSYMSGQDISSALRLPFYGVLDHVINLIKKEQLCEVSGTAGLGEAGYQYVLTAKGMERAQQILARSSYVGPAPVPLGRYIDAITMQTANKPAVNKDVVENALRGMIISEELTDQIGAAVNAGKSLFVFGAPGNGKTLMAARISTMLGGSIAIPYALEADGQIIQLFDLNSHRPVVPHGANEHDSMKAELHDRRWVRVHRPVVNVGGELTMSSLDLIYNDVAGFYEAPFQLKANGGLFLIDDFGRQQMSPQALLNRWIVPLEKGIDFLTLKTGKKLQVPFELFLVLSTNLQPDDLMDDAFLRRIQNKINVPDPTPQQYFEIFITQCKTMGVTFDQHGFAHLVKKHYMELNRPFRASHPRDLLRQLLGIAKYRNVKPELTPALVDAACATYFVTAKKKESKEA